MAGYNRQATKQSFDRDGYTVIRALFSTEEIDEIHGEIARYVRDIVPELPQRASSMRVATTFPR